MSVQELLNLTTPRAGRVDPGACVQCAAIRKRIRKATKARDADGAMAALEAMRVHKRYGHPTDSRRIASDLPGLDPKITRD
ncbi:hypothetical protein GCM10009753_44620 [Streptantibioticus ferralitis]